MSPDKEGSNALLLGPALLHELEERWRKQGASIIDRLRPGLSDDELDDLTGPLGLVLPTELRAWWGWHDGASLAPDEPIKRWGICLELHFYPLADALDLFRQMRSIAVETSSDSGPECEMADPDFWWSPSWIPVTDPSHGTIACESDVSADAPSPVFCVDYELPNFSEPRTRSLGQLVSWWVEAMRVGYWRFENDGWITDEDRRTDELSDSWLV